MVHQCNVHATQQQRVAAHMQLVSMMPHSSMAVAGSTNAEVGWYHGACGLKSGKQV